MKRISSLIMTLVAGASFATSAMATTNLVLNGGFETLATGATNEWTLDGASLADWTLTLDAGNTGATVGIIFGPGAADNQGAEYEPGLNFGLYGPGNGNANGLPAASPDGGNYFAADDPVNYHQTLSQTVTGLQIGQAYAVTFDWAAAQVTTYSGPTQNQITVSLDNQQFSTPLVSIANHGFSGWITQTFNFTATGTSEVLGFAFASPQVIGSPPAALLDGVSLTALPEPTTWAMMLIGFTTIGFAARRRRTNAAAFA